MLAEAALLDGLGHSVQSVFVTAAGDRVFEAKLLSPESAIGKIDGRIKALQSGVFQLDSRKRRSLDRFRKAHEEATRELRRVSELIWSGGTERVLVDTVFVGVDLLRASRGGLVGVTF